jgi:2-methylcitrate dehydratase PrpD
VRDLAHGGIVNALAIAATTAPSQSVTAYTRPMDNNVKEGIPWATAIALTAVALAAAGFTGLIDLLDDDSRYDRSILMDDLGPRWHIENVYFKPYSCNTPQSTPFELHEEHGIDANTITAIHVETCTCADLEQ